jgi:two-component system chemotaxis response regulator CheB
MASRLASRVLAVGASAGGVEALIALVRSLPADFPAPVLVVLHVPAFSASNLPSILNRAGPLKADHARDHDPLVVGRIYVAPPDFHLLAMREDVRVVRGPHENNNRPAIDPLFRSIALAFGPAAIALVLTGTLDDGAAGAVAVTQRGGTVVVQDPDEALYPSMPLHVIAADHPTHIAKLAEIPAIVDRLVREPHPVGEGASMEEDPLHLEQSFAAFELDALHRGGSAGHPAPFSCPSCGGTLWEAQDDSMLRFRCRVGHAFGAESLLQSQTDRMDEALWTALRALEERRSLALRMAEELRSRSRTARGAESYEASAEEAERQANVLRDILIARGSDRAA